MWRSLLLAGDSLPKPEGNTCGAAPPGNPGAWRGGCFHTSACARAALQAPTNPIFALLLPLEVLQLQDVTWTSGTPGTALSLQPRAPSCSPTGAAQECWEHSLAGRKSLCLQIQSCALTPTNTGIWEGFRITCLVSFWIIQLQKSYICLGCSSTTLSEYQVLPITSYPIW